MHINKIYNQDAFQGENRQAPYFEGWYFKIDVKNGRSIAIIPGISYTEKERYAFIQINDSRKNHTEFIKYPITEFRYKNDKMDFSIGINSFSKEKVYLNIIKSDYQILVDTKLIDLTELKKNFYVPNIMGPFAYIPCLECRHGVISMQHTIKGFMQINNEYIVLDEAKGYIEKDYGVSFPKWWLWLHTCNFKDNNASFMLSLAAVPIMNKEIKGVIGFLNTPERIMIFATYYGAKIKDLNTQGNTFNAIVLTPKYRLEVEGCFDDCGTLLAPVKGVMSRMLKESVSGKIEVHIENKKGITVFHDTGSNCGIEISRL